MPRDDSELDREAQSWIGILTDRYVSQGMSREDAARRARMEFNGVTQAKETVREQRRGAIWETVWRDVAYACRTLRKNPGFTLVAVATLALGIGANSAIFSLVDAVMLRLLPVDHPEQLVLLTDPASSAVDVETRETGVRTLLSYPEFDYLRRNQRVFSGLTAAQSQVSNLELLPEGHSGTAPIHARTQLVSGEFFEVLGVRPLAGRVFTAADDRTASPIAVISYDFWRQQFDASPEVLGRNLRTGHAVFQIVGVTPPEFHGITVGSDVNVWFPITTQPLALPGHDFLKPVDTLWLHVMGRLAPGVSRNAAEAGINVTFRQSLSIWALALPGEKGLLNQKIELKLGGRGASTLRDSFSDPLMLLMGMVGVVLLIACANLANLMLARARNRQREVGVRLALGASRWRLIRQLLTESLLVAAFGGVLGIAIGIAGSRLLVALVSAGVSGLFVDPPRATDLLLFTAAISVGTGLAFGLVPALRASRLDLVRAIGGSTRGAAASRGNARSGRILVVTQVALSVVLLTGAALFVRSLRNKLAAPLGFERDGLLTVPVDTAQVPAAARPALYERLRARLRQVPGVEGVTLSNHSLFGGSDAGDDLSIEGSPEKNPEELHTRWSEVGADYFKTMGVPVLLGREISADDAARGAQVCVINEAFRKRLLPDGNPLGRHITDEYPTTRETYEIIGVVADAKEHSTIEKSRPRFYANIAHPIGTLDSVAFLLRNTGDEAGVVAGARQAIREIDRNLPILEIRTVVNQINRRLITERLLAQLASFFGTVALFMAAIGLYGVISYSMSQRRSEIGIRMALGASARSVVRMVLRQTIGMVAIGLAIGVPCAIAVGRLFANRLYALQAADPLSMAAGVGVVLAAALLAGYVPARRAARGDPMISLRHE
ncbi:MAG TPA: ABC transporter permease [Verrucomicrobiae bacterium]|nr:ABC transporter permease [Verrucomicrobiae bacterium]